MPTGDFLLTLDLSSRSVGWTCGMLEDLRFASGTQLFPKTGDDIGAFIDLHIQWLESALNGVGLCVMEAPILPKATSLATCRKLYGQSAVTEYLCRKHKIECLEVSNMSVKAFFGVAGAKDPKAAMMDAVLRYGYDALTDDEADAIAIRLYIINKRFPHLAARFGLDLGLLGTAVNS
ncbi:MAG: hypothetical protein KGL35_28820 [Bradyrhizobium sp.]|nr:hypothetical protein [Bradyrhizobium sp.]